MQQDVAQHPAKHQRCGGCFALLQGSRQPLLCGHTYPFLLSNICGSTVFIGTFLCASSKKYNKAVGVCWGKISKLRLPVSVVRSRAMEEIKVWQSCIFRAIFSLRGAFMLCNVWNDVLASFQHSNYKFCLRCEGQISLKHTRDTCKEKIFFQMHKITSYQSQLQRGTKLWAFCHIPRSLLPQDRCSNNHTSSAWGHRGENQGHS